MAGGSGMEVTGRCDYAEKTLRTDLTIIQDEFFLDFLMSSQSIAPSHK